MGRAAASSAPTSSPPSSTTSRMADESRSTRGISSCATSQVQWPKRSPSVLNQSGWFDLRTARPGRRLRALSSSLASPPTASGQAACARTQEAPHGEEPRSARRPPLLSSEPVSGGEGYPSETHVKRGGRVVGDGIELLEKLGRNDPCPCGSMRKFKKCCLKGGTFRRSEPRRLRPRRRLLSAQLVRTTAS